jgi:hypothetical protein
MDVDCTIAIATDVFMDDDGETDDDDTMAVVVMTACIHSIIVCNKTITGFCISKYDLSFRIPSIVFYRSIETHIHFYKSL